MSRERGRNLITIILTAIGLGMGVAAVVLITMNPGSTPVVAQLLGIGLFTLSLALFNQIT